MNARTKRITLWVGALLLVPLLLMTGMLWWAGSEGSLARALQLVQRWMPDEQHLVARQVTGSIRHGGHVGKVQWRKPGLTVSIEDLRIDWSLQSLLDPDLRVQTLSAALVQVLSRAQPDRPDEPFVMPARVSLPLRLAVPLSIARLDVERVDVAGATGISLQRVLIDYRYDGTDHLLNIRNLEHHQSHGRAALRLNGETLALSADLTASLRNLVPDAPLTMEARLTARGSLAGADAAVLNVSLDARQAEVATAGAAQIIARAQVHPFRKQPAQLVDVELNHVNTHAFHARAPTTALRGHASLEPSVGTSTWQAAIDLVNDLPDAWDHQRLPLRQLRAKAELSLEQLDILNARAELGGRVPGGMATLQGSLPLLQANSGSLALDLQQVDLRQLVTTLPRSSLSGPISLQPSGQGRLIQGRLGNRISGPWDAGRLPLDGLIAKVTQHDSQWEIDTAIIQVGAGQARIEGIIVPTRQEIDLRVELQQLPLRQIHRKLAADATTRLTGTISASGALQQGIAFQASAGSQSPATRATSARSSWEIRAFEARGKWSRTRLIVERVHLDAFQATADGGDIDIALPGLDSVRARLNGAGPGFTFDVDAAMSPQLGGGRMALQLDSAEKLTGWLRGLPLIGAQLPELHARGAATLEADWRGNWRQWMAGIKHPAAQPGLHLNAVAHSDGFAVELPATATQSASRFDLRKLDLSAQGNLLAATLSITADASSNDLRAALDARIKSAHAQSRDGTPRWNLAVDSFAASARLPGDNEPWKLQLSDNLQFTATFGSGIEIGATAGSATLQAPASIGAAEPLKVTWEPAVWHRTPKGAMTLQSTGSVAGIQPAWLDTLLADEGEGPLTEAGMRTDLVLSGNWDLRVTDIIAIRAGLTRDRGDLSLVDSATTAGMRTLDVTVQAKDENVNASLNWDTEHAGVITARIGTRLQRQSGGWTLPGDSPLSGNIEAKLQDLSTWAFLAPPGWRFQGELDAALRLSGTVQSPQMDGSIEGQTLNVRSVLDGVDLHNGTLRTTLHDSRMQIAELRFEGGTGSRAYVRGFSGNRSAAPSDRGYMTARGYIDWSGIADPANTQVRIARSRIAMKLDAELRRMQVLVRNDRQMTLSGGLSASLDEGLLRVRGDLKVDRASIVLPESSAPKLGDDVVINRRANLRNAGAAEAMQARGELQTRRPMDMEIKLDLGRDLALEGQGITTRLEGELTVRSTTVGSDPFRVFGEVRTVEGRYRAWGQALDVETGVVRFNGPYGNPSLDLLAIRPKIDVRAGVRVTGTLLAPRVQLYSEPELPEGEKLSWVVLGRATVITGAEGSSMQQAALGLAAGQLAGRLASGLGVDELGLSEEGVSIGKRISNELYLTYQQGLAGAASTLFIFYDITRKLTIRAQASEASAVDLVYTIKFD